MPSTKISIILSCYNGSAFLEETIQSVLNQSYQHFTFYLINGSTIIL